MIKLKWFIIGFIVGSILSAGITYASIGIIKITLIDSVGNSVGTTVNPLYIQ